MLILKDLEVIIRFMKSIKEKGQFCFLEYNKILEKFNIIVEFDIDEFECMEKYIKDWIAFHTDIVDSYCLEINNNTVHFIIYLIERF